VHACNSEGEAQEGLLFEVNPGTQINDTPVSTNKPQGRHGGTHLWSSYAGGIVGWWSKARPGQKHKELSKKPKAKKG
jgi:hypothetical protein